MTTPAPNDKSDTHIHQLSVGDSRRRKMSTKVQRQPLKGSPCEAHLYVAGPVQEPAKSHEESIPRTRCMELQAHSSSNHGQRPENAVMPRKHIAVESHFSPNRIRRDGRGRRKKRSGAEPVRSVPLPLGDDCLRMHTPARLRRRPDEVPSSPGMNLTRVFSSLQMDGSVSQIVKR
jgi:hypothetical protein